MLIFAVKVQKAYNEYLGVLQQKVENGIWIRCSGFWTAVTPNTCMIQDTNSTAVERVWAEVVWGGGVGDLPCIKIGYSSRLVPRAEKGPQPMY